MDTMMSRLSRESRRTRGEFTDEQVRHIKKCLAAGYSPREVAELYGKHVETIRRIDRGESYRHVTVAGERVVRNRLLAQGVVPVVGEVLEPAPEVPGLTKADIEASKARLMALIGESYGEQPAQGGGVEQAPRHTQSLNLAGGEPSDPFEGLQ